MVSSATPPKNPFSAIGGLFKSPREIIAGAFASTFSTTLGTMACLVLNHLLDQHRSAKYKLQAEAGKVVAFEIKPVRLALRVNEKGYFQASRAVSGVEAPVDTEIAMDWADLAGAVRAPGSAGRKARISGDMDFAQVVAGVIMDLQWDPEHDLARIIGDAQAIWVMNSLTAVGTSLQDVVARFKSNLREYVVHEKSMTPTSSEFEGFRSDIAQLRDEIARLEKRLEKLGPA